MNDHQDRRQYGRIPKQFKVEVSGLTFSESTSPPVEARCVNISAGGLLLDSPQSFQIGDKLQVRLFIPRLNKFHPSYFKVFESSTGQNVLAVAEVVRTERGQAGMATTGIKFLDVYEDDWQALYRLLQSLTPQE